MKDGVKMNLDQNAVYSTFPDFTSILLFPLSEEDSLPYHRSAIHHSGVKYDHFALKHDESSKSAKVCFKNTECSQQTSIHHTSFSIVETFHYELGSCESRNERSGFIKRRIFSLAISVTLISTRRAQLLRVYFLINFSFLFHGKQFVNESLNKSFVNFQW